MDTQLFAVVLTFAGTAALFFVGKHIEKRSINKAILAEVDRLIHVVREHEAWWQRCIESKRFNVVLIPFSTDIYDKQVVNIGAIDGEYVAQVVKFFGYVKFLNRFQKTKPNDAIEAAEFAPRYLSTLNRLLDEYDGEFETAFSKYDIR